MTERWQSTPRYFCEVCRVWLNDNPSARATHERGAGHQDNVAKKLRDMRKQADADKKQEALAVKTMSGIEARAKQQYERDLRESARAREELTGTWEPDTVSGHLYNERHRHYYDTATRMYYGGEPPAWTLAPAIPPEALYKPPEAAAAAAAERSGSGAAAPAASGKAGSGKPPLRAGMRYAAHPLSNLGGYQMPTTGKIGGAKGIGSAADAAASQAAAAAGAKRGREAAAAAAAGKGGKGGKAVSAEEAEAQARREAARARVQQRTMQAFGLR